MKKKVLILSFSPIARDPRVMRQIHALEHLYDVTVCGWGDAPENVNISYLQADETRPGVFGKTFCVLMAFLHLDSCFYWGFKRNRSTYKELLSQGQYDLILANDLDALPIACRLADLWSSKIVADMHECFIEYFVADSYISKLLSKYNSRMCKKFLPKADACMTVSEGIAERYNFETGVNPSIVINAPLYEEMQPSPVDKNCIRLVHHGSASRARNIMDLIEVVKFLDKRFLLELVLVEDYNNDFYNEIVAAVEQSKGRVKLVSPFPMKEISRSLNAYDIGVYALPPDRDNHFLALPNKLFEWIQGRLGVVTWPLPEMQRVIENNGVGVVSDSCTIESMVETLNSLTVEQIQEFKRKSNMVAKMFNSETNMNKIRELVDV